jgi:hypothetical protein
MTRCDFCGVRLRPTRNFIHVSRLGDKKRTYCDAPKCQDQASKWRLGRLHDTAKRLGLMRPARPEAKEAARG